LNQYRQIIIVVVTITATLAVGGLVAKNLLTGGAAILPPTARQVEVLRLINVERSHHGLPPMLYDAQLAKTARAQTALMIAGNYFDHRNFEQRMQDVHRSKRGEMIAWGSQGYHSAARIVAGWVASPPHEKIITTREFTRVGVGTTITPKVYQGFRDAIVATVDVSTDS
jgi:uncharacterized protein YkwD